MGGHPGWGRVHYAWPDTLAVLRAAPTCVPATFPHTPILPLPCVQYHGLYNWLLFVVISVPVNAVLFALWIWYRAMEPRRFVASFLVTGTAFALCVALALVHYQHEVGGWQSGQLG